MLARTLSLFFLAWGWGGVGGVGVGGQHFKVYLNFTKQKEHYLLIREICKENYSDNVDNVASQNLLHLNLLSPLL